MIINKSLIHSFTPCDNVSRFNEFYSDWSGTAEELIKLDKITFSDKIWVLVRVMSQRQNVIWTYKCFKSIEPFYSRKVINDFPFIYSSHALDSYIDKFCNNQLTDKDHYEIKSRFSMIDSNDLGLHEEIQNMRLSIKVPYYVSTSKDYINQANSIINGTVRSLVGEERQNQKKITLDLLMKVLNEN